MLSGTCTRQLCKFGVVCANDKWYQHTTKGYHVRTPRTFGRDLPHTCALGDSHSHTIPRTMESRDIAPGLHDKHDMIRLNSGGDVKHAMNRLHSGGDVLVLYSFCQPFSNEHVCLADYGIR